MQLEELAARVQSLEEENRRLKSKTRRWGLALAALGGVAVLSSMTAVVCETVWAERFVLKDSRGRQRGFITAYETGGAPQLALLDAKGARALTFGVDDSGRGYFEVGGANGPVRSHFSVSPEGKAGIEQVPADKPKEPKKDGEVAALSR